jgi:Xaa-Pro aminopeptidase
MHNTYNQRIKALRKLLVSLRLDGFIIPRSDEHMNEYVPAGSERLAWISGFSGSAGLAVVLRKKAAIFVDGRYTLQVRNEVDTAIFTPLQLPETSPSRWILENEPKPLAVGYDPRLHSIAAIERLEKKLSKSKVSLVSIQDNPVDQIWEDRPSLPRKPAWQHPLKYAGQGAKSKISAVHEILQQAGVKSAVLTLPDSLAWLFNIRGGDLPRTPVVLCFAIIHVGKKCELFIDGRKIIGKTRQYLSKFAHIHRPGELESRLRTLKHGGGKVQLDPKTASCWFRNILESTGCELHYAPDPCIAPKAIKNRTEIAGARNAHHRDGIAVSRFLQWLEKQPAGSTDEIAAAEKLEKFRRTSDMLVDLSFDTISGVGANGAIVHYKANRHSCRKLEAGSLYLVDSGGQYHDGTTDITRTIAIGEPTLEMCQRFTMVLKAHIAIATARFPEGTRGCDIDVLARNHLWRAGLDYNHGTGHGVGSFLSVHEGPQAISKYSTEELKPGMIISNEPGYYKEGEYGIRIENLLLVTPASKIEGGEHKMLGFETLSLVPIANRLVAREMLSPEETRWLDDYNDRAALLVSTPAP